MEDFNINKEPKGLGDTIANITHTLGIDKVADAVAKLAGAKGCGCDERRQYLNELFPYGKKRKFKILRSFGTNGKEYIKDSIIEIGNDDPLHQESIILVQEKFIEEI